MSIPLPKVLELPELKGARLLAGAGAIKSRAVGWASAIEWPVEGFVARDELLLTTGIGCDEPMLRRVVDAVSSSGAAGLIISAEPIEGEAGPVAVLTERAGELDVPLVEVPWSRAFSDISRAVIKKVIEARYSPGLDRRLGVGSFEAILRGEGIQGICEALEASTDRPVLVLGPDLLPLGYGPRFSREKAGSVREASSRLEAAEIRKLRSLLSGIGMREVRGAEDLELGPGWSEVLTAAGEPLGFLCVLDDGEGSSGCAPPPEHLVHEAAVAASIELVHRRRQQLLIAELEGDALWQLADGTTVCEAMKRLAITRRVELRDRYIVALGRVRAQATVPEVEAMEAALRVRVPGAVATSREDEVLALFPLGGLSRMSPRVAIDGALAEFREAMNWGVTDSAFGPSELRTGYRRASRISRAGRFAADSSGVAHESDVGTLMLLEPMFEDEEVRRAAREVISPVLEYDRDSGRDLLRTLEILLEEEGNQSATARRLYLNRHSVLYRARKIEELTGRSLASPEDRLCLQLATRIERLSGGRA